MRKRQLRMPAAPQKVRSHKLNQNQVHHLFLDLQSSSQQEAGINGVTVRFEAVAGWPQIIFLFDLYTHHTQSDTPGTAAAPTLALNLTSHEINGLSACVSMETPAHMDAQGVKPEVYTYALNTHSSEALLDAWIIGRLREFKLAPPAAPRIRQISELILHYATTACRAEDPLFGLSAPPF